MKKFIFIFILPFLLSDCYDYNGLNDLAIISGIAIDYEEDEFGVTFEVISTKKEGETSGSSNTYYVTSKGNSLVYAFTSAANKMDKVPYFEHVEVVVFSSEVAKNHLEDVVDYLIRTERLRNEFYAVIGEDSAHDLITASTENAPIVSNFLVQLLEFNNETYNSSYYTPFTKTLNSMLSEGEDAMLPVFKVDDDKNIELDGLGVFQDFKLVSIFNNDEASILNLLHNFKVSSIHFQTSCEDGGTVTIAVYKGKTSIEPNEENTLVKASLQARISESTCNYNFKEVESYLELESEFTKIIEEEMDRVLKKLQQVESNALNIGKSYYNKYREKDFYLWTRQEFVYDLDLQINKKGLTFEVET